VCKSTFETLSNLAICRIGKTWSFTVWYKQCKYAAPLSLCGNSSAAFNTCSSTLNQIHIRLQAMILRRTSALFAAHHAVNHQFLRRNLLIAVAAARIKGRTPIHQFQPRPDCFFIHKTPSVFSLSNGSRSFFIVLTRYCCGSGHEFPSHFWTMKNRMLAARLT
jgi:hypothetical protein